MVSAAMTYASAPEEAAAGTIAGGTETARRDPAADATKEFAAVLLIIQHRLIVLKLDASELAGLGLVRRGQMASAATTWESAHRVDAVETGAQGIETAKSVPATSATTESADPKMSQQTVLQSDASLRVRQELVTQSQMGNVAMICPNAREEDAAGTDARGTETAKPDRAESAETECAEAKTSHHRRQIAPQ